MSYNAIGDDAPLRLVFLGCGDVTKKHVGRARYADKNLELSFASRTIEKAEAYKNKHKGAHAFGSYDEAIYSDLIDVVMVNTPPNSHYALAKKVLEAGKHLIVEKPPFLSSTRFDELGAIADGKGLQLMVAENYFYKPLRYKVEEVISKKLIGETLFIQINATKTQKSKNDWREDKSISGFGALFEGGIHWISFINNIGLKIKAAKGFIPHQDSELERSIQVTAETEEGAVINLIYSWEVSTIAKGLRLSKIYGRDGSTTFETNGVMLYLRGKKSRLSFPKLRHIAGYKPMFKDFFVSLRSGKQPVFNYHMAKKDLVLIEQIYASTKN